VVRPVRLGVVVAVARVPRRREPGGLGARDVVLQGVADEQRVLGVDPEVGDRALERLGCGFRRRRSPAKTTVPKASPNGSASSLPACLDSGPLVTRPTAARRRAASTAAAAPARGVTAA
jgi:hypothetical protein